MYRYYIKSYDIICYLLDVQNKQKKSCTGERMSVFEMLNQMTEVRWKQ